jgi:uncharacterized protein (TIGR02594 family)
MTISHSTGQHIELQDSQNMPQIVLKERDGYSSTTPELKPFVVCLQRALSRSGAKNEPDGMFGPNTTMLLKSFQQSHNLLADGITGNETWFALVMFLRPSELKLLTSFTSHLETPPVIETPITRQSPQPSQSSQTGTAQKIENSFNEKQKMSIKAIQQALIGEGFDPGPADGIRGRQTIKAIKEYQRANGLTADGLVGSSTESVLFKNNNLLEKEEFAIPNTMPWLETAYSLMGTQEITGAGSNEAILGWAEDLELTAYNDDDIPWCGLFVAHCIGSQMPDEVLPNNPLGARQWQRFGKEISPRLGSIMVFWRGSRDGWKGHVGFYWAQDNDTYYILGGNQANSVSVTRVAKNRLLNSRWPNGGLLVDGLTRIASANGRLISTNEA